MSQAQVLSYFPELTRSPLLHDRRCSLMALHPRASERPVRRGLLVNMFPRSPCQQQLLLRLRCDYYHCLMLRYYLV